MSRESYTKDTQKAARVLRAFELVNTGLNAEEIRAILGSRAKEDEQTSILIGLRSEQNVYNYLRLLPEVRLIIPTQRFSEKDCNGIDIEATLKPAQEGKPYVLVNIQVRSSSKGILRFIKEIGQRYALPENQIEGWLTENHFIILNGQRPRNEVIASFRNQFWKIQNFKSPQET